jgi:squalene cyclase
MSRRLRVLCYVTPAAGLGLALALVLALGPHGAAEGAGGAAAKSGNQTKVTRELERCVERGLDFLARTQGADGSWDQAGGGGGYGSAAAGLAMMAMMAHGEVPDDSKYGKVIRKAVDYLVTTQQSNGLLAGRSGSSPVYSHGFATLAMAEVYGMIDDPRVGPALKKATGLIVSSQNRLGGWRYSVGASDADTTVSGAQMIALRAAANAGMEVPEDTIRRGVAYFKTCFCRGGGFGYTSADSPDRVRGGIGLLVLSLSGEYRSPEAKATADYLFSATNDNGYFYYMAYYCSQAMFQAGGKYWQQWNETMTPLIIGMQTPDGSWQDQGESGGLIVGTSMALLAIEVNYNLLPIYQR